MPFAIVADVSESMRLMADPAARFVCRWSAAVDAAIDAITRRRAPLWCSPRGDGMVLVVDHGADALAAVQTLRRVVHLANADHPAREPIRLRIGLDEGGVTFGAHDAYGDPINIAARLAALAAPDETLAAERAAVGFDPQAQPLGVRYLRNRVQPLRVCRIGPAPAAVDAGPMISGHSLRPLVAVVPFDGPSSLGADRLGEALAAEVSHTLARSQQLGVISPLSSAAAGEGGASSASVAARLRTHYVVMGRRRRAPRGRLALEVILVETAGGAILWSAALDGPRATDSQNAVVPAAVDGVARAILRREIERSRAEPLPALDCYTLMASAIALMHRLDRADFDAAQLRLDTLIARASRQPAPLAWMAKWRILRVLQNWSDDPARDAGLALQATDEALRADPGCALALTMRGFALTNLKKDFVAARDAFDAALAENASESLAWLMRGTLFAFSDRGAEAVRDTTEALTLSPCDPHRYFYLCLAAGARLTSGDDAGALTMAEQSRHANPRHLSTLRILATAQWRLGLRSEAQETVSRLRTLDPGLTAKRYLEATPAGAFRVGREVAGALRAAGLPA